MSPEQKIFETSNINVSLLTCQSWETTARNHENVPSTHHTGLSLRAGGREFSSPIMNVTPAFLWFYYFSYIFLQTKSLVLGFPRLLVLLARPLEILMTALMSHINCDHRLSKMKQLFKSKIIIILIIRLMWNLNELVILSLSNNLTSVTWTVVNESECFAWKQKS